MVDVIANKFDVRNTRDGEMTDTLRSLLQAQSNLYGEGLVGGVAHISLDTSDAEELPSGMVTIFDKDAIVHPSSIPNTLGQYLMVTELLPRKDGYKDADFQSESVRRAFNANIPQFNEAPPSYDLRHPRTNMDVDAWGPELGQEDGMVGVYKVMEANGRDARYFLAVRSSIPEVVNRFKQDLGRSEAMVNGEMTFEHLINDKRLHYVDYLGRRNGYKLMYSAMKTLKVAAPFGGDGDHYVPAQNTDDSTARPMRAEPESVHAITTITPLIQGGHERIAVYNGVTPSTQCGEKFFTYVSPYDGIVQFNMEGNGTGLSMPVLTGRRSVDSKTKSDDEMEDEIIRRAKQSSIIWEQSAKYPAHPDLHPEGHYNVDKAFLRSMQQSGWKRENERDHMIPVLLKISNPALRRPRK